MRCIKRIFDPWFPWSLDLLVKELVSVNRSEPWVISNVHVATCEATVSIRLTTNNETLDEILCLLVDSSSRWKGIFDLDNAFEQTDLVSTIRIERRTADKHFIHEYTKRPVINPFVVTLGQDDFWSKIFRRTAQSVGLINHNLGESKINENLHDKKR